MVRTLLLRSVTALALIFSAASAMAAFTARDVGGCNMWAWTEGGHVVTACVSSDCDAFCRLAKSSGPGLHCSCCPAETGNCPPYDPDCDAFLNGDHIVCFSLTESCDCVPVPLSEEYAVRPCRCIDN